MSGARTDRGTSCNASDGAPTLLKAPAVTAESARVGCVCRGVSSETKQLSGSIAVARLPAQGNCPGKHCRASAVFNADMG